MTIFYRLLLVTFFYFSICYNASAQPGSMDTTFNPLDIGFRNGDGGVMPVVILLQQDNKIIAAGEHHLWNDFDSKGIIRLNEDGKRDTSFNPGSGISGGSSIINAAVLQPDGKIIIAGDFESYNGIPRKGIARINSNGSLDAAFNPGSGADKEVKSILLQPDGKIIIAGNFINYNSVARKGIARINSNGSIDPTFNPGTGVTYGTAAWVNSMALQTDGKIIIGGFFTEYNGTSRTCIARINSNGGIDSSFNPGSGANDEVTTISLQPDGRIIIGGNFTAYSGSSRNRLTRIDSNGTLDLTFNIGSGASAIIRTTSLQADGKILVGGEFENFNNTGLKGLIRLNTNGSNDAGFNLSSNEFTIANASNIQTDGKLLVSGNYSDKIATRCLVRINTNGSFDTTFNRNTGANHIVHAVAVQADGKILLGGEFSVFNNIFRRKIVRLNSNGSIDTSFNPLNGATGSGFFHVTAIHAIAIQTDGKILIGGEFTSFNGGIAKRLVRLNTDGSVDGSFNIGIGANDVVRAITLQPDGKILVGGSFININGAERYYLARINSNGSIETSFNPQLNSTVNSITLQSDGKIIITGSFSRINNTNRFNIARLNYDGTLDISFNPGSIVNNAVTKVALQNDGKLIIAGNFTSVNSLPRKHVARITSDGSVDASFNSGNIGFTYTHLDPYCTGILIQPNGKIILTGRFLKFNNVSRSCIVRLNKNGSLDSNFIPGTGVENLSNFLQSINAATFQTNGKLLIGGEFQSYNNVGRNRIARIHAYSTLVFNGNGNWIDPTNWLDGIAAPTIITDDIDVIIDPVPEGACNHAGDIRIQSGGKLQIRTGKKLNVSGSIIQD